MDEKDLFATEYPVSASEDEGDSDTERKHRKLLDAISSLDGKKRRKLTERTEASLQVSEFGISAEGAGDKLSLSDLIQPSNKSSALSTVKKQLKNISQAKSVELPLTREQSNRIQRVVAYEKTTEEVSRWENIVKQNRKADQLVFPQNDEKVKPARLEEVVTRWKPHTPLEMEIFNVLHKNKQPVTDPLLTPVETASLKAMSLEEAKLRRAELQKARALQSYYESKMRREKKIKSKKFHKVLKKSKQKEAVKVFEELRKTNPEAALEELQKIKKTRIEERMSLKHQNSGKWAKSKAIMAKYDDDARQAIQEQLQKNKDLTRKIEVVSESEESEEEGGVVPDFVNDAQVNQDGLNPWMSGKLTSDAKVCVNQDVGDEAEADVSAEVEDAADEDSEDELSEEENLLQEFEDKRRLRKMEDEELSAIHKSDGEHDVDEPREEQVTAFNLLFQRLLNQSKQESHKEKRNVSEGRHKVISEEPVEIEEDEKEDEPFLMETLDRKQDLEDLDALGQEALSLSVSSGKKEPARESSQVVADTQAKKPKLIDHNDVLPVKAVKVKTPLIPTAVEEEEEEDNDADQKMIIKEAFAGDDVIRDFLKEKEQTEKAGKPKDIDLVLPGWGEWGGTNLRPSKRKRKRFTIKASPALPRKDQHLPNVIINEKRDAKAAAHQVSELPFPYNNPKHFESTIRAPVGNTWNTERSVQKLTAPKVITKQGHVIEPIAEEVLQKRGPCKKPAIKLDKPEPKSQRLPKKRPHGKHPVKRKHRAGRKHKKKSG
uniref:U3 small nucleolar RNA-associated protein 14 homolog A n=1 Tax=Leptobrachium leishanense TaxID=445787 RepID=A0A8C5PMQ9_9ANUR